MQGIPSLITVDPGSTHMGKLHYAKELVRVAADSGADVIKFQLFKGPKYTEYGNIELPRDWLGELAALCEEKKILFSCSVFDKEAADLMIRFLKSPYIKFSYSMKNSEIIKGLLNVGRTLVVSTDRAHIQKLPKHERLFTLFCVPSYPNPALTNFEDIFLNHWGSDVEDQRLFDGLSDHSMGFGEAVRAVEAGARMVEKHITLPYADITCPDSTFALTPKKLKRFVQEIRKVSAFWPKQSGMEMLR